MKFKMVNLFQTNAIIMLSALAVIGKIITGHNLFLVLYLIIVCYGIFKVQIEDRIIYLLFYSSWIYVLKFNADSFSLFHIIQFFYIISFLLSMMVNRSKINLKIILGYLLFVTYILINSIIISNGSLSHVAGFLLNFTTVALVFSTTMKTNNFNRYVLYYASGIALSGFVALIGTWIPAAKDQIHNMGESYTIYRNDQLFTRFSGLDIDPNYFAFQVLFAISLLLIITQFKKRNFNEGILILILLFMGINTLSKMFFILLFSFALYILFTKAKNELISAIKYITATTAAIIVLLPLGLSSFVDATLYRFSGSGNSAVSVTTGRFDLWMIYIGEIFSNPHVFLIGNGIGSGFLNGFAAHNMYLTFWYFTGFFGVIALLFFMFNSYIQIKKQIATSNKEIRRGFNKMPLMVLLIANLALDSILMNFFPILIYLTILAVGYVGELKEESPVNEVNLQRANDKILSGRLLLNKKSSNPS